MKSFELCNSNKKNKRGESVVISSYSRGPTRKRAAVLLLTFCCRYAILILLLYYYSPSCEAAPPPSLSPSNSNAPTNVNYSTGTNKTLFSTSVGNMTLTSSPSSTTKTTPPIPSVRTNPTKNIVAPLPTTAQQQSTPHTKKPPVQTTDKPTTSPIPDTRQPQPKPSVPEQLPAQQPQPPSKNLVVTTRVLPTTTNQTTPTKPTSHNKNYNTTSTNSTKKIPTLSPTVSFSPCSKPSSPPTRKTTSFPPTKYPSSVISKKPTNGPTYKPTYYPSIMPSSAPTLNFTFTVKTEYLQTFAGGLNLTQMNENQTIFFRNKLESYTYNYSNYPSSMLRTIVTVEQSSVTQSSSTLPTSTRTNILLQEERSKNINDDTKLLVFYTMEWQSNRTNISDIPDLFLEWMDDANNSVVFVEDLVTAGLDLIPNASDASEITKVKPDVIVTPTPKPTAAPTIASKKSSNLTSVIIAAVAGIGCSLIIAGSVWFFYIRRKRSKKRQQQQQLQEAGSFPIATHGEHQQQQHKGSRPFNMFESDSGSLYNVNRDDNVFSDTTYNGNSLGTKDYMFEPMDGTAAFASTLNYHESSVSHPSMVSDDDEYPTTDDDDVTTDSSQQASQIVDEFDRYKNQDLEKMREEVEGNVDNMGGMMSQALTMVLMEQDEYENDEKNLLWGASGNDHAEIEASVLCETHDWLKRKEDATLEERNAFMQILLNRMVATVRYNYIPPEKGSRAIHGAAAMLGLQLAGDLPETAILVSGMRHKAEKKDLIHAFQAFGEIEDAAVAPNFRGFGLVRFLSPKAVQRATEKYRTDRIDVQDVSVNVRVLSAPAVLPPPVEVTRQLSNEQRVVLNSSNASASSASTAVRAGGGGGGITTGIAERQQQQQQDQRERKDRGRGVMESNRLPPLELNTIGYPSDSLGKNDSEKFKRRIPNTSDSGSIGGRSRNSKDRP